MRQGATEEVEVWLILESGKAIGDYDVKTVYLYYNNGISSKILAAYRDIILLASTTPSGPPLGADWEYFDLEVDNPFVNEGVTYSGALKFTIDKNISNIMQDRKVRKPEVYIEVVLQDLSDGTVIKEEYSLTEYFDSISAGLL